ncbi:sugar ABC transporter ATP-binding protein [Levilinea saccharolytica]|uniref:D-ribose transporter ATP-binding protein n=1 Tax=Levilinea saccharolytica TaxID=229921 RepID=A0A0P6XSW8_9CHLR|nr:ATP-binding cassette domain-containing protein [Levilinea saccharolytica]KPL79768.1 D-ribose transporter ATP-binding protein [Levilinea saccharolytica]GAP16787.1 xylose ABC transporter ATP-binding protein [Levilinea saccharolytica]
MSDDIILDIRNVTKQFPGVTALSDVSLQIKRGEIHGLCGENGAGKSTLMKILSGVYPFGTYEGTILYEGQELRLGEGSIQEAIKKGIAIVYQELTLVPNMNVGENVYLGKEPTENGSINWNKLYSDTRDILQRYNLDVDPQTPVKDLGVGKQQMVEIAKALSENAKILILDEPTSALSEAEIASLMDILRSLKSHGVTCIYITHKLDEFFRITDTVTVLRDGKTVVTKPTSELNQQQLVSYMVGREMKERFPKGNRKPGDVIFEVEDLHAEDPSDSTRMLLRGVSLNVRQGEILGIAGLMGSGRTELVTTIFGEYGKVVKGTIKLQNRELKINSARDAMQFGISLVPEDRKRLGLVLIQSILKNISLPNLDRFASFFRINADEELAAANQQARNLAIKAPHMEVAAETLSGGNQQKVVIAKWLLSNPKVLILDDPTRGIDVGAKYEIYKLMNELAEQGVAIIMISSDLEEVLGMSDRVMVMCEGRSSPILELADATQEHIMKLATGIA